MRLIAHLRAILDARLRAVPAERFFARIVDGVRVRLEDEADALAVWLAVFAGTGVLSYYALRFEPPLWCGPAAAALLLAAAIIVPMGRLLLAPAAALALGFAAGQIATARMPPIETGLSTHAVSITGTVQAVELLPDSRRITIRPAYLDGAADPLARSVRIRLRGTDQAALETGATVTVRAVIRQPAPPVYPGARDLQRDAFYSGLGASGYALGPVDQSEAAHTSAPVRLTQQLREIITGRILAVIPGAAGAVSVTLLTGASMAIPPADHAAFRDSGLAHLLAVAGLHIGIVMGFFLMLARYGFALSEWATLYWPTRMLAALCALAAGGLYMLLTGMHVPIMRSFGMAALLTLALMTNRRGASMRGLALAAAGLSLLVPWEVPDVSFQMSFAAVLALIAGYEALRPWLRRLHGAAWHARLLSHIVALALTSALAGSASAPYGAYHFGQVQAYFVLANMAAVPLTAFWVMPAGLIALFLMPLHLEAVALVPMGWGAEAILWVARRTTALPDATFVVPHMPEWGLCVFSLGLCWLCIWRTRWRLFGVIVMAAGLASPLLYRTPDVLVSDDGRLIAMRSRAGVFLQAGQGGSKFVRDAWLQYWAAAAFRPMADDPAGAIRCEKGWCLLRPRPDVPGVLLARGARSPGGCAEVSVIVSAEPARGLCPKPWPALVDRFTVWRYGSTAIWLDPAGAHILTDRAERGDRPWVPPLSKPRPPAPAGSSFQPAPAGKNFQSAPAEAGPEGMSAGDDHQNALANDRPGPPSVPADRGRNSVRLPPAEIDRPASASRPPARVGEPAPLQRPNASGLRPSESRTDAIGGASVTTPSSETPRSDPGAAGTDNKSVIISPDDTGQLPAAADVPDTDTSNGE